MFGGPVENLVHKREALRRGRGEGARARRGGADARDHRRVFALHLDELRVHNAVGDELAYLLHHLRLRRDGIRRDDLGARHAGRVRYGVISRYDLLHNLTFPKEQGTGGLSLPP